MMEAKKDWRETLNDRNTKLEMFHEEENMRNFKNTNFSVPIPKFFFIIIICFIAL